MKYRVTFTTTLTHVIETEARDEQNAFAISKSVAEKDFKWNVTSDWRICERSCKTTLVSNEEILEGLESQ